MYDITKQLWKSKKTMIELISDRGFTDENIFIPLDEFIRKYEKFQDVQKLKNELTIKQKHKVLGCIMVFWVKEKKVDLLNIMNIHKQLKSENVTQCILVIDEHILPKAKNYIYNNIIQQDNINITIYEFSETLYNITKHFLVPNHSICSKKEASIIMDAYHIEKENLPGIRSCEPCVKYIGAVKGQLIKIIRKDEHQVNNNNRGYKSIYYRVVI